jgi:hypothetical protein
MTLVRSLVLLLAMTFPAAAGGLFLDLPNLTWPATTVTTQSTMQGDPAPK